MKTNLLKSIFISLILVLGVSNAWAGDPSISGFGLQFQDDGGHWFKTGTKGGDGIMDADLGSKTNLKIVYIYANGNKNGGNLCGDNYFKYGINGTTSTSNWGGVNRKTCSWNGSTPTYKWGTENGSSAFIDLVQNKLPGNYSMEFIFSFNGANNTSDCGIWYDCKYSGSNWKFSWSIPDPTITISGADNLIVGTSANITAKISNYPIGAKLTKVQVSGNIASSKSTTGTSDNITVSSVTPNASGKNGIKVTVTVTFGTGGTKDYVYNYNVTPPAINNFQVTPTGYISGSGTSADPYIIPYNQSLKLSLSGSKAENDANSTLQYNTSGTWNTTTSKTISNIISATKTSVTVKMRCHNSTASLSGTESSKTIYYRAENLYTVTFNANGHGTAPTEQKISEGSKATEPTPAPQETGYTFGGWYKEANCTNAFDFNTVITEDITLYAKWTANKYTVTLDNQSATTAGTTSVQATYGSAMPSATMPTKTGYTFGGYYTEKNGGGTQYYKADGTSATTWNLEGAQTLYAKWEIINYTITYNTNGGNSIANKTYTIETATFDLPVPTKIGYTFAGWYDNAGFEGNPITSIPTGSTGSKDLYAKWEARELFLNASWIIWGDDSFTAAMTQDSDNPAIFTYKHTAPAEQRTEDTNPRYHNFRFVHKGGALAYGWKEVDEEVTTNNNSIVTNISNDGGWHNIIFSLTRKSDITITLTLRSADDSTKPTVHIDATPYYNITLDQTGCAQPGTTTTEVKWGSDMPEIKLPVAPIGYTFGGYYTEKNGGGTQYYNENGGSAKAWNIAANTTLYAKWTAIKYNITYTNLGGATHTNAKTYTIEDAITFSAPSARNGYTFAGWYPASIEKGSTGDKTITAQWTEKPGTTVYLKANDMWKSDGAKLAVYAWNNTENTWLDVEYDDCTGNLLMAEIPAKYNTGIKFVRLNPNPTSDETRLNNGYNFDNAWNQTSDLNVPTNNKNLYDLTQEYIYLKPNNNWKSGGARFAAYFFGNGEKWVDMTDTDGDGYYSCKKTSGYTQVIFCRMNPNGTDQSNNKLNWNNRWDQSKDQTIPNNNLFTIDEGQWGGNGNDNSGATGHWNENHWDNSQWTTYTAPTYTVTINPCENGTIQVAYNGQTYTSGAADVTIKNVLIHSELTITFTPAEGYEQTTPLVTYADVVADNTYSICGPATISAEFVQRGNTKVIYLRPNDDWLKDNPIFIAHAWKDGSSDLHDYLMTTKDDDYTGAYSCTIDSKYDHVLFARINPEYKTNQELKAEWMWNKTINLRITNDVLEEHGYRFAISNDNKEGDLYNGAWEENTPIWGLTADFNNWNAERFVFKGYPGKMDVQLSRGNYQFKLYNFRHDHYYGNSGTYRRSNHGEWWTMDFHSNGGDNCTVTADVDNEVYLFQLQMVTETGTYKKQISITYPNLPAQGDYRLAYHDNAHPFHPGHLLKQRDGKDTVSFFVHYNNDPVIMLQQVTAIDPTTGAITWETRKTYALTANQPGNDHPGQAMMPGRRNAGADEVILHIGGEHLENVDATGVYNFILEQTSGEATLQKSATKYDGNFYIRTNAAAGGWVDFRQAGNKMTYSSYADSHSDFNHYFVEWIEASTGNVEFTIANDYSYCISDTLVGDAIVDNGWLPANANVRFGWDSRNNKLTRAYIAGSGNVWDRFLVVTGNDLLKDASGNVISAGPSEVNDETKEHPRCNLKAHEVIFTDLGNWVYQVDVTAQNGTMINLTALYNGTIQYFKGAEGDPSYPLLASTNYGKKYKIRMIYNFKTNHLVVAWMPDSPYEVDKVEPLGTDMLLIRRDQEQATQIQLNSGAEKINNIETAYAVMTFTKTFVEDDKKPIHQRKHYWVSFPFDVKISDVFGFSEYKDHWIMQAYDGAGRAANGLWADTDTYWKYITNANYVMRKGQGYVLTLDVKKMLELDPVFTNTGEVSLYFPSRGKLDTITSYVPTAATVPAHTCTIERENRKIYDSHWNMIGVPGFADIEGFNTDKPDDYLSELGYEGGSLNFYYQYIPSANSYQVVTAETTFQSMYSYMVQFAGTINWSSKEVTYNGQQQLAARRNSEGEYPEKVSFRLELAQGDKMADQTFVQLQQEGATSEFDMNLDLTKIINSGANIYTLAGESRIQSAGNALPMGEAVVVPVGVKIDAEGEYTFRMPDGTEGMVVELVDYETNNRTNLLLTDYTVTLPKGTSENRFALHIQPQKDVVTSLENIGEGVNNGEAVNKYLIDGKLIIRTAEGIFDAQGHRL